ncbi:MAG: nucleotidyltransferase [Spirochaetaceae bacterium]|nr:MAG: nucleotidyltransferase [Spirochaetaceae bacterium]
MKQPALVVLAAGMGSRYGGLKQVDPIGPYGATILDYSVFDAHRAGFGTVVFVIRRDIEQLFRRTVGSRFESRMAVEYVFQALDDLPDGFTPPADRAKPWGTAHAVWAARNCVDRNFAVINADDYYGAHSYRLLADHLRRSGGTADFAMIGYLLGNTLSDHGDVNRAVCRTNARGELIEAVETLAIEPDPVDPAAARYPEDGGYRKLPRDALVSMNIFGFTPEVFPFIEEHLREFLARRGHEPKAELYIPTVVNLLIAAGRARMVVIPSQDTWFGVTYSQDKPYVESAIARLIAEGVYPQRLWADQA